MVPQWVKVLGVIGGAAGAIGATIASGGSVGVAILVGLGAATTGASALYMPPPKRKQTGVKGGAAGQAVDTENPK